MEKVVRNRERGKRGKEEKEGRGKNGGGRKRRAGEGMGEE